MVKLLIYRWANTPSLTLIENKTGLARRKRALFRSASIVGALCVCRSGKDVRLVRKVNGGAPSLIMPVFWICVDSVAFSHLDIPSATVIPEKGIIRARTPPSFTYRAEHTSLSDLHPHMAPLIGALKGLGFSLQYAVFFFELW